MMEKKMRNSTLPGIALTAILTLMCGCSERYCQVQWERGRLGR